MPLRNSKIDYDEGWFSVTMQVAHNKTVFGVISGEECVLNALGTAVRDCWRGLPARRPNCWFDEFVVMPNHFHAVVRVGVGAEPHTHDIDGGVSGLVGRGLRASGSMGRGLDVSGLVGRGLRAPTPATSVLSSLFRDFKSFTTNKIYYPMCRAGACVNIGRSLWQSSFYDNLISSHRELLAVRDYIADNPRHWNGDRFGPVTSFHAGNLDLLSGSLVAFVASEGRWDSDRICEESGVPVPPDARARTRTWPVISTFTSAQERFVLRTCLAHRRPFVWVMPGGIPDVLPSAAAEAVQADRAVLLSPVAPGTGVNKQRAVWCNTYVLRQAAAIRCGHLRPGGTLESLLRGRIPGPLERGPLT